MSRSPLLALSSFLLLALFCASFPNAARAELTLDDLRQTESQIQELSTRVMSATVSLIPGGKAPRMGTGSGVVVSKDGLILTAAHVAMEMTEKVTVIFPNGDRAEADVLGMDFSRDAAMLQIVDKGDYDFVELGDSDAMKINEWCVALGHAGGFQADRSPPVRLGRVVENDPKVFLISDSALIGGDSGGPLFDIDGKLIGIHSNIGFSLAQNRHVPISVFVENWERLKKGERFGGDHVGGMLKNPERPVIGALLEDADDKDGAFVRSVLPGSPAAKAGLETGDTVIQMGSKEIKDVAAMMSELKGRKVGDTLRLTVRNGEKERGVAVKLVAAGKLPQPFAEGNLPNGHPEIHRGDDKGKAGDKDKAGDKEKPKAKPSAGDKDSSEEAAEKKRKRQRAKERRKAQQEKDKAEEKPENPPTKPKPKPEPKPEAKKEPKPEPAAKDDKPADDGDKEEKEKEKEKPSATSAKDRKALQAAFDKHMRDSIDAGELEMTPEQFEKFGGPEGFRDLLRDFQERLTPADIARLMRAFDERGRIAPEKFDPDQPIQVGEKFFREVLDAFHTVVAGPSDATHLVFRGSEWKTLCTVVREDGYAVTKASELEARNNKALNVLLGKGRLVAAEVVHTWPKHDLALLQLDLSDDVSKHAGELTAVSWHRGKKVLPLGSLIAAVGSGPDPLAIGVVSVQPRSLSGGNKGFLGIGTESDAKGVRVTRVLPSGNAGKAGVKVGDIITQIDETVCDTPERLIRAVSGTAPGATVTVHYIRNGEPQTKDIKLGDRGELDGAMAAGERHNQMNRFGTEISRQSSGYLRVLQSDLPIEPEHCGGPVVDLDGDVIGLNIARAGRIKTYALLADDVAKLVDAELKNRKVEELQAKGKPKPKAKAPAEKASAE